MVVIECPHCSEEIEMDDDAYGLFECPYCEGEYEWGEAPRSTSKPVSKRKKNPFQNTNRKIDFSIEKFSSRKHRKEKEESQINSYGPLDAAMLFSSIFMMALILFGLNSNSWYVYSYGEDSSEFEANFGHSYVEYTITDDEREYYYDEGEKYYYFGGSITGYESQLSLAESIKKNADDFCEGIEDDDYCVSMQTEAQESIDWWNSWDTSGDVLFYFLFFTLIGFMLIVISRIFMFANHNEWLVTDDNVLNNLNKADTIFTLVTCSILVLGLLLYWMFVPNVENWWDIMDTDVPSELSSGLGFIWWLTMLSSMGLMALASITATTKKRALN